MSDKIHCTLLYIFTHTWWRVWKHVGTKSCETLIHHSDRSFLTAPCGVFHSSPDEWNTLSPDGNKLPYAGQKCAHSMKKNKRFKFIHLLPLTSPSCIEATCKKAIHPSPFLHNKLRIKYLTRWMEVCTPSPPFTFGKTYNLYDWNFTRDFMLDFLVHMITEK